MTDLEKVKAELPPLPPYDYYVTLENGDDYGCWSRETMREYAIASLSLLSEGAAQPEFTDMGRAALLNVLWHHQGHNSPVGQPIRFAIGMGRDDRLSDEQIAAAKRFGDLSAQRDAEQERKDAERLEACSERLDNLLHATKMPMPAELHVRALTEAIAMIKSEIDAALAAKEF